MKSGGPQRFRNLAKALLFKKSRYHFTYTGREWDKETGLYYYRARYYDPMEGRFISKDPILFAGGDVNLYGYVQNNAINYYDPSGLAAAGRMLGGQVGGWAAGALGVETGPFDVVIIAGARYVGGIAGSALEDWIFASPANLTPDGAGRRGALRQVKRDNDVPCSQGPNSQDPNKDKRGNKQPGRQYNYTDSKGNNVTIRDDAKGHNYPDDPTQNRGSHFNGPDGKHYDY